ncbi:phosphotransferase enzyme family protein [Paenibacillus thermotolerans]|uniref:phosphotransferase enzyme family protein n=1 Tax=Paenibacillus thermotolerans TaxID=3027807 RepID=UPI002367E80E|nr:MULTISPECIES: phosphotransferase [unclassified Paenibacillus]
MESVNRMDNAIIAQHALAQYDINVASVSPIAQSGAAVFKIKDNHGLLYSLRVHVPKSSTLEKIWTRRDVLDSELIWLDALNRDTSLTLPVPKRNQQGTYVTQVDETYCTMLNWVVGEQKQYFTSEQELKSTAEMTAALHRQASKWQSPSSFVRPTYNSARVRTALDMLKQRVGEGLLDAHDVQILNVAGEKAIALLDTLPKNNMTWGVLHNDLFPNNIVYVDGVANPIDFGASGYGFFLNDLACTFCFIHPQARQQYIDWYGEHFPLPNDYVTQLEGLFIASRLTSMIHSLGLPDANSWLPTDVQKSASREFGRYAIGEHFLFTGTPFWE